MNVQYKIIYNYENWWKHLFTCVWKHTHKQILVENIINGRFLNVYSLILLVCNKLYRWHCLKFIFALTFTYYIL